MIEELIQITQPNKYTKWYINIINNAKLEHRKILSFENPNYIYLEKHHIIPKSIAHDISDFNKHPNNLVLLTPREHIICHWLLCRMFVDVQSTRKMINAFVFIVLGNPSCRRRKSNLAHTPSIRVVAAAREKALQRRLSTPRWYHISDDFNVFKEHLLEMVNVNHLSDPEIGKMFNTSAASVNIWRKKLCISSRRSQLRDRDYLYDLYINHQMSAGDIAAVIGCTGTAVQQYLNKFSIPIRSASDRQILASSKRKK